MRQITVFFTLAIAAVFLLSFNASAEEPEYENPDLQLKFNLKEEGDMLSPQTKLPSDPEATKTVMAQSDNWVIIESGRETVVVGTWTSEPVEFDVSVSINSFDIWWESMESGDDSCYWTIEIQQNEQMVTEDESDCTHGGEEIAKGTHSLSTSLDLLAGDTFGIKLSLTSWEDAKIYYDNSTYDTGLNVVGKHNFFFAPTWSGSTVTVEFAEAWPVNWQTNLDGGYIMLMGDDMYMADNSKASIEEGNEYTIQMANGSAEVTSLIIKWTDVSGTGIKLMMDYNTFDHMPSNNTGNGTAAKPPLLTVTFEKSVGVLGDDGALFGLPGFELMIAIPAIAFVARRYRTN